jgi:hypothetical protein
VLEAQPAYDVGFAELGGLCRSSRGCEAIVDAVGPWLGGCKPEHREGCVMPFGLVEWRVE